MEQETPQEINAVRAVLRNEITWIVFIICSVWGAVVWIVLSIQALQLGQSEINVKIVQLQQSQENIQNIKTDVAVMAQQIKPLQDKIAELEAQRI